MFSRVRLKCMQRGRLTYAGDYYTFLIGLCCHVWLPPALPVFCHLMRMTRMLKTDSSGILQWLEVWQCRTAHFCCYHCYCWYYILDEGKVVYSSSRKRLTATGNHVPYGITRCYLSPNRGDIPAFTPAEAATGFSDPGGIQGWVDLVGWLELVYPRHGNHHGTKRAWCWLTSLCDQRH